MEKNLSQSGQVGLVVLLVMTALLSVGIGAVSRSTQDLKITRQEVDSSRAFNAAEAGVEEALFNLEQGNLDEGEISDLDPDLNINYSINPQNEFNMSLVDGVVIGIDATGATSDPLLIQWGLGQDCSNAPNLAVLIYNISTLTVRREGYFPNGCSLSNGFVEAAPGTGGYLTQASIPLGAGDELIRLRPMGGDTDLRVSSLAALPVQYHIVRSTAQRTGGEEVKVVEVHKSLPAAPVVFDYALFSGTTIIK